MFDEKHTNDLLDRLTFEIRKRDKLLVICKMHLRRERDDKIHSPGKERTFFLSRRREYELRIYFNFHW